MKTQAYFDYAAATPVDPLVLEKMRPFWSDMFFNPSALYLAAKSAKTAYNDALEQMAHTLGCRASELVATSGATEANNMVIRGVAAQYPSAEILVSATEHDSIVQPALAVGGRIVVVKTNGLLDIDDLKRQLTDKTVLLSCMFVNNETGVVQQFRDIQDIVKSERERRRVEGNELPLYLHTDATQAVQFYDCSVARLGVDAMTINSGKIYGPKGVGLLYLRAGMRVQPLLLGGGQSHGMRSGTENVAGVVGMSTAVMLAQKRAKTTASKLIGLRRILLQSLEEQHVNFFVHGHASQCAPHIASLCFPGHDNERLAMELDERGICVATGSACNASNDEPSHVLSAMQVAEADARSTIRVSMGAPTTEAEVEALVAALTELTLS